MPVPVLEPPTVRITHTDREIDVSRDPAGGWLVTATVDGRVIARSHCDHWHRVERVRRFFAFTIGLPDDAT